MPEELPDFILADTIFDVHRAQTNIQQDVTQKQYHETIEFFFCSHFGSCFILWID